MCTSYCIVISVTTLPQNISLEFKKGEIEVTLNSIRSKRSHICMLHYQILVCLALLWAVSELHADFKILSALNKPKMIHAYVVPRPAVLLCDKPTNVETSAPNGHKWPWKQHGQRYKMHAVVVSPVLINVPYFKNVKLLLWRLLNITCKYPTCLN